MPGSKTSQHSIEDVIAWAEKMKDRGSYHTSTANNHIAALRTLTSILSEEEPKDAQSLLNKLEDIADRWARKEGAPAKVTVPKKSHARRLLADYLAFQQDPTGFKPGKQSAAGQKEKGRRAQVSSGEPKTVSQTQLGPQGGQSSSPSIHLDIQIHISPDASEKQIDAIFESMAKHLNLKK